MIQFIEKTYIYLFYCFFSFYVFFIYPWGEAYYYANAKAYYFLGFTFLISLLAIFRELLRRNRLVMKWYNVGALLALLLVLVFFSTIYSSKLSLIGFGTEHQGLLIMLSYVLLFNLSSRLNVVHIDKLIQLLVVSSFFASVYSILQYFHLAFLPQDADYHAMFGQRTYSFFDNPDYFGSYLVLVIPLTIILYLLSSERKKLVLYFFIFFTQFLSLVESQTRSAWLGVVIGSFIMTICIVWKRKKLLKKWALLLITACLIFAFSNVASHQKDLSRAVTISSDVHKIITNKDAGSAGASRWDIWQITLPSVSKHFWLGTGPNTFEQVFYSLDSKQTSKYYGKNKIYDANNDYLQMALTMGVPALLIYLLVIVTILFRGIRQVKELDKRQQLISIGLIAAIIGYLVQAFFNISVVSVTPYFWLILGFFVNLRNKFEITV